MAALTRVFLPLAVPGLVTVALFAFINSWNEFLAALIFMNQRHLVHRADPAGQRAQPGNFGAVDWGALQASVIISIIPCLAVYLALQRYYISGLLSRRREMTDRPPDGAAADDRDSRTAHGRSATSRGSPASRSERSRRRSTPTGD